jgi:hypothetical protein
MWRKRRPLSDQISSKRPLLRGPSSGLRLLESKREALPSNRHAIDCCQTDWQTLCEPGSDKGRWILHHIQGWTALLLRESRTLTEAPAGTVPHRPSGLSDEPGLRITWFGHASSLVKIDGVNVLIDPVWDERAAPTQWAGPKRFFPPTLSLQDLPHIDVVLISHDHYDHLGEGTVQCLARMESLRQTRWVTPLGVAASYRASARIQAAALSSIGLSKWRSGP